MDNQIKSKSATLLVMSCSGASNTGAYTDMIARQLDEQHDADMVCLTKIAIGDPKLLDKVKNAHGKCIILDGCPIHCANKILNNAGISEFIHLTITDFGIKKGVDPIIRENVDKIIMHIKSVN